MPAIAMQLVAGPSHPYNAANLSQLALKKSRSVSGKRSGRATTFVELSELTSAVVVSTHQTGPRNPSVGSKALSAGSCTPITVWRGRRACACTSPHPLRAKRTYANMQLNALFFAVWPVLPGFDAGTYRRHSKPVWPEKSARKDRKGKA